MVKNKSKKKFNKYSVALVFVLTLITVATLFLNSVCSESIVGARLEFSGLQIAFGYAENSGMISVQILGFSIMAFLAYLLPIVGAILFWGVKGANKLLGLVSFVCFLASAVLMVLMPNFVILASTGNAIEGLSLGIGAIIGACVSALNALIVVVKTFVK